MSLKLARFALCLFAIAPGAAYCSNWYKLAALDLQDSYMSVDLESIAIQNGYRKAWFVYNYSENKTLEIVPPKKYDSVKLLQRFNCSSQTLATIQAVYYLGNDVVFSQRNDALAQRFEEVIPDTFGERQLKFICAKPEQKATSKKPTH